MSTKTSKISKAITGISHVEFDVDDVLVVADPGYLDEELQHRTDLILRLPECGGRWHGEVVIVNHGDWGDRVEKLILTRQSMASGADVARPRRTRTVEAENGVDSGQMYGGCESNLPLDYEAILEAYRTGDPAVRDGWEDKDILAVEGGVVSSTGFGDGVYPVQVARSEGVPYEVIVTFLTGEDY